MRRPFSGIDTSFELERFPVEKNDQLFAFDSADELIIRHLLENDCLCQKPWVIGDSFGALTLALAPWSPRLHSDSVWRIRASTKRSTQQRRSVHWVCCPPPNLPSESPQLVIIRIPKSLAQLEHQLADQTSSHLDHPNHCGSQNQVYA